MADPSVDHEARKDASEANLRIESHEKQCTERWKESRKAHDELRSTVATNFWWTLGCLGTGMLAMIGLLVSIVVADARHALDGVDHAPRQQMARP